MRTLFFFIFLSGTLFPQSVFQNFITYVSGISDPAVQAAKIDSFMSARQSAGFPAIEGDSANFLYRGNVSSISVAGDFNGWSSSSAAMKRVGTSNFYYYSREFELNARVDYKFVTNGSNWILDPLNPRICSGGFGPNSELAMPQYVQPWEIIYNSSTPHGTVTAHNLYSTNTSSTYQIKFYTPSGYNPSLEKRYPVVYFQDGYEYIDLAYAVNVLDNLINAGMMQPVIGVFVRPNNRNEEYAGNLRTGYKNFFVNELVPYVDANYKTFQTPDKRVVLGDSYGGNISAYIAYHHPDVFGNCGLHSGAFQSNGYEVYNLYVNNPAINVKFVSVWGTYESLFTNMRNFRDNLISKGYFMNWMELPEGHSWGLWRATIDFILMNLAPVPTKTDEAPHRSGESLTVRNYPNPFAGGTNIAYTIPANSAGNNPVYTVIKVYDLLGREIAVIEDGFKSPGSYETYFPKSGSGYEANLQAGIYFIVLRSGSQQITKEILLIK